MAGKLLNPRKQTICSSLYLMAHGSMTIAISAILPQSLFCWLVAQCAEPCTERVHTTCGLAQSFPPCDVHTAASFPSTAFGNVSNSLSRRVIAKFMSPGLSMLLNILRQLREGRKHFWLCDFQAWNIILRKIGQVLWTSGFCLENGENEHFAMESLQWGNGSHE